MTLLWIALALFVLLLPFFVYLFLMMPRVSDRADMDFVTSDYAHRGLWNRSIPENSLAAFAMARDRGYGIELDIRLSKDRRVMVFHDDSLLRMCGVEAAVEDLTYAQLKQLRLKGTSQTIPTLAEVLALVDGQVPLLIEIKGKGQNRALCQRASHLLDRYYGAFAVQSFDPRTLAWFKGYRPRFARGQLLSRLSPKDEPRPLLRFAYFYLLTNLIARPDFISVRGRFWKNPSVFLCHRLFHCKVFLWTVRNEKEYRACRAAGCFAIFERFLP